VARGHRYQDVVDGYPVTLVWQFLEAAQLNRERQVLEGAVAISLGISDAFAKGELLKTWLEQRREAAGPAAATGPNAALQWFAQQPVKPKTEN
jgi:hypothetical protein